MKKILKKIRSLILGIITIFFFTSLIWVMLYRIIPVKITPTMVYRFKQPKQDWEPIKHISPHVYYCAIASEDPNFLNHYGFDFEAIKKAYDESKKYKRKLRGGSGISQQCAKNVFLLPVRSWVRKAFETYFTILIETFWNKKRIMEVYLNIIEMGDGIYGIESAAKFYYKKPASRLNLNEAAMIVSCFPNPRKFTPLKHPYWIGAKQSAVMTYSAWVPRMGWDK